MRMDPDMFYQKKKVLKNFGKFHGKTDLMVFFIG